MSTQLQVTYFTRETAPHRPVLSLMTRFDRHRVFNLENWYKVHDEKKGQELDQYRATYHWPPCGACDWDYLQRNSEAVAARREIKRRVRQFEKTGKFPPGWLAPDLVKFGGAKMGEKEASRVVLPRIPLSPKPGSDSFLREEDLVIEDPVKRYLDNVNRIGSRILVTPEQEQARARTRRWRCGCTVDQVKSDGTWVDAGVTPCKKHKGALEGREEE